MKSQAGFKQILEPNLNRKKVCQQTVTDVNVFNVLKKQLHGSTLTCCHQHVRVLAGKSRPVSQASETRQVKGFHAMSSEQWSKVHE